MFRNGLFVERVNIAVAYQHRGCIGCFERNTLGIDIDGKSTVVNLIGNGESRVVVVCRTNVPNVLGNQQLAIHKLFGVGIPAGRNQLDFPFVGVRHFHDGEHFSEVIFDTRDVHFV